MTTGRTTELRIPRDTFASMVTERLRSDIVDGVIAPGAQLNEMELAQHFGVSRGPVREALQRLIQEGLLLSEPHRGVFVPVLTDDDVTDIYLVRGALEMAAIKRIVANGAAEVASASLDQHVEAMEKAEAADDWKAVGEADLEFHASLVASSGSARLQRMFGTVISETRLCLGALSGARTRAGLVAEHRSISGMVRAGDTEQALQLLGRHFGEAVLVLTRGHNPGADGTTSVSEERS